MKHFPATSAVRGFRRATVGLSAVALALTVACKTDSLVNLQNPDVLSGTVARDPANLDQLMAGAQYEFARALTGPPGNNGTPGIIGIGGLFTDEMWYVSTFTGMQDIDRRNITIDNTNLLPPFQYLNRARVLNDDAAAAFAAVPARNNTANQAKLTNYAGFSYVFLAEDFCSGVPISSTDLNGVLSFGGPQTTTQVADSAIARFTLAKQRATGDASQTNLASIGLARALLVKGDYAGAAAAVSGVPTTFAYDIEYSPNTTGQYNGIYQNIVAERRSSVATREGTNGLAFFNRGPKGSNTIDPRVVVDSVGKVNTFPYYKPTKYDTVGASVRLASGIEARLVEAENALNKGNSNAYLATLNTLRSTYFASQLPPLVDPVTPAARVSQFFQERAFWLYLTGHRMGDLRRLVRDYPGFTQDQVFPVGQTVQGGTFGTDVNFPIPLQEQNNPSFTTANGGCLDRKA